MKKALLLTTLGIVMSLVAVGHPASGQETNPALSGIRPHDLLLGPVFEIQEQSGEFERWGREITVTAPEVEVFRWSTRMPETTSAKWSVMDGPPGSGAELLATGSVRNVPQPGRVSLFRIDFRRLLPSRPPATAKTYWVVLESVSSAGQTGPKSAPVQVTYAAPADRAVFAGRVGNVVAPSQMAVSKGSKLGFLSELAREIADLPANAGDEIESAVAEGDIPDAQVRLTPAAPASFVFSEDALPVDQPHHVSFNGPVLYRAWTLNWAEGEVETKQSMFLSFSLAPDELHVLDITVTSWEGIFYLRPMSDGLCLLDFQTQRKEFPVPTGTHNLLAVIERPASLVAEQTCRFQLAFNPKPEFVGDNVKEPYRFYSAELTRLTEAP